ncbi:hypothetical protein [Pseudomonas aeruginosa]|uniref:hypothetical protein n=1 Tax=Pseudomonas aeruginosa TaxID=287 RepID=UPI000B07A144|nr:hypothetical protein [Pseudomonas aeruginosa]
MYLPALKNAIQNLEEKLFYDVALMYLTTLGYQELSMVDGTGDGGRDVTCSREDLRIQLSVRRDWRKKINEEASNTERSGHRHLIYVTNKIVSPDAEQEFIQSDYSHRGTIDLSTHDLKRIVTALSRPGVIRRAYELLNMAVPSTLEATPKDIALSTLLLFSQEANELREAVINANTRAHLFKNPGISENVLIGLVENSTPGTNVARAARGAISQLRTSGRIVGSSSSLNLSPSEQETMKAAEAEFLTAAQADVTALSTMTSLSEDDSRELLNLALNLLIRGRDLNGTGPTEEALRSFIAKKSLNRQREKIFDALSRTKSATFKQYGATIDRVFSTNTFDIYRALGRRTDITVVLDASVAMPVMFGLEFGAARSRYGIAALALRDACKAHNIRMTVPRCYLNEMAAHGRNALEKLDVYNNLPEEARISLRASGNAYLSHYTHIHEVIRSSGDELSLQEFLQHFGIADGRPLDKIENKISSILESHGIAILPDERYDQTVYEIISSKKTFEIKLLIEHDAIVCSKLKNDDQRGFILATWDKIIIDVVEDIARVFADTPARVIDFLSMAHGQDIESDQNYELLSALIHTDEKIAQKLAEKVDHINSVEQAYKLRALVEASRQRNGEAWTLKPEDITPLLDPDEQDASPDTAS